MTTAIARLATLAGLTGVLASSRAGADPVATRLTPACVVIDEPHDQLEPRDRVAAKAMFARVLERAGQLVLDAGCETRYVIAHTRTTTGWTVRLHAGPSAQTGMAGSLDGLYAVYDRLANGAVDLPPGETESTDELPSDAAPSLSVEPSTAEPIRTRMFYARVGGASIGHTPGTASSIGGGFRYQWVSTAFDFSIVSASTDGPNAGSTFAVRAQLLSFRSPGASSSWYYGGGLSMGTSTVTAGAMIPYSGYGPAGELTAGYGFARSSAFELFVQTELTVPIYTLGRPDGDSLYAATFAASAGVGF